MTQRKINMLQVVGSMDPSLGGMSQGIRNTIPAVKGLGVHNEVVCMDDPHVKYKNYDAFPIYFLGPAGTAWAYSSKLYSWLKDNLSRFDAVIVNGLWLYPGYAVLKAYQSIQGN